MAIIFRRIMVFNSSLKRLYSKYERGQPLKIHSKPQNPIMKSLRTEKCWAGRGVQSGPGCVSRGPNCYCCSDLSSLGCSFFIIWFCLLLARATPLLSSANLVDCGLSESFARRHSVSCGHFLPISVGEGAHTDDYRQLYIMYPCLAESCLERNWCFQYPNSYFVSGKDCGYTINNEHLVMYIDFYQVDCAFCISSTMQITTFYFKIPGKVPSREIMNTRLSRKDKRMNERQKKLEKEARKAEERRVRANLAQYNEGYSEVINDLCHATSEALDFTTGRPYPGAWDVPLQYRYDRTAGAEIKKEYYPDPEVDGDISLKISSFYATFLIYFSEIHYQHTGEAITGDGAGDESEADDNESESSNRLFCIKFLVDDFYRSKKIFSKLSYNQSSSSGEDTGELPTPENPRDSDGDEEMKSCELEIATGEDAGGNPEMLKHFKKPRTILAPKVTNAPMAFDESCMVVLATAMKKLITNEIAFGGLVSQIREMGIVVLEENRENFKAFTTLTGKSRVLNYASITIRATDVDGDKVDVKSLCGGFTMFGLHLESKILINGCATPFRISGAPHDLTKDKLQTWLTTWCNRHSRVFRAISIMEFFAEEKIVDKERKWLGTFKVQAAIDFKEDKKVTFRSYMVPMVDSPNMFTSTRQSYRENHLRMKLMGSAGRIVEKDEPFCLDMHQFLNIKVFSLWNIFEIFKNMLFVIGATAGDIVLESAGGCVLHAKPSTIVHMTAKTSRPRALGNGKSRKLVSVKPCKRRSDWRGKITTNPGEVLKLQHRALPQSRVEVRKLLPDSVGCWLRVWPSTKPRRKKELRRQLSQLVRLGQLALKTDGDNILCSIEVHHNRSIFFQIFKSWERIAEDSNKVCQIFHEIDILFSVFLLIGAFLRLLIWPGFSCCDRLFKTSFDEETTLALSGAIHEISIAPNCLFYWDHG